MTEVVGLRAGGSSVESRSAGSLAPFDGWDGTTYYGRAQLKEAPFQNPVVGGYIFLAGLSGASAILATLADLSGDGTLQPVVRRGRYLSLLAPVIGSALLVYDLHTPKRFYNMLRVAKSTSPMSIGTWILMSFSAFAGVTAGAQAVADHRPRARLPRWVARAASIPAAFAGMGMSTYTASLLAATSTPLWAAAPQALAVRFGSSSVAAAAAALSLGQKSAATRRRLEAVASVALATEAIATMVSHETYEKKGVGEPVRGRWGMADKVGGTGLGVLLPLGVLAAAAVLGRRSGRLGDATALAILAGSALMRVSVMEEGDDSANRPEVSFRFSEPRNLPGGGSPGARVSPGSKLGHSESEF